MKKGFTFAELMISLVIISVISAILYPTIADLAPNENAALFKSAYRSMSIALAEVMNDTNDGIVPHGDQNFERAPGDSYELCEKMARKLNVRQNNCDTAGNTANTFTTSNGMRWYVGNTSTCSETLNSCNPVIIIDVAASNNDIAGTAGLTQNVTTPTGTVNVSGDATAFTNAFGVGTTGGAAQNTKDQDTFIFVFNETGKMVGMDTAGYAHVEGKTYKCESGKTYNLQIGSCH